MFYGYYEYNNDNYLKSALFLIIIREFDLSNLKHIEASRDYVINNATKAFYPPNIKPSPFFIEDIHRCFDEILLVLDSNPVYLRNVLHEKQETAIGKKIRIPMRPRF